HARGLALALILVCAEAARADAEAWTLAASGFVYAPPDQDVFFSPIVDADRGALLLEARYNYEDLETGSIFVGETFLFGKDVSGTVAPLVGLVLGKTDAAAPGLKLDVAWRRLEFYTESEVVIDFHDVADSFLYSWLEGKFAATKDIRLGVVGQHT